MNEQPQNEKVQALLMGIKEESIRNQLNEYIEGLQTQNENLQQEKKRFFDIVAYWLKSPLDSLGMLSSMLLGDLNRTENTALAPVAQHLDGQVNQLKSNMGNLMQWACLQVENYHFSPAEFAVKALGEELVQFHQPKAEKKGIQLLYNIEPEITVFADKAMLKTILGNLLDNAIKFSTSGATVTLNIESSDVFCQFLVQDTGIGMGKGKLKNIFNLARKAQQKGTANENGFGLGLAVSQALLALHQQAFSIQSERGSGTSIRFSLPKVKVT